MSLDMMTHTKKNPHTLTHTYDTSRLTYTVQIHWVNFHSAQTIFSCLAWREAKLLPRARHCHRTTTAVTNPHTYTHGYMHVITVRGLSLESVDGTNYNHLWIQGLTSISLSVAALCPKYTKARSVWPSDIFNNLLLYLIQSDLFKKYLHEKFLTCYFI